MMRAADIAVEERCRSTGVHRPALIGVTVLTSLDILALKKIGVNGSIEEQVSRLATLAAESGMDGLVASPLETLAVRREVGEEMLLVTPGVQAARGVGRRPEGVSTPADAMSSGADFLVVGRPLYRADDPVSVAREMLRSAGRESE